MDRNMERWRVSGWRRVVGEPGRWEATKNSTAPAVITAIRSNSNIPQEGLSGKRLSKAYTHNSILHNRKTNIAREPASLCLDQLSIRRHGGPPNLGTHRAPTTPVTSAHVVCMYVCVYGASASGNSGLRLRRRPSNFILPTGGSDTRTENVLSRSHVDFREIVCDRENERFSTRSHRCLNPHATVHDRKHTRATGIPIYIFLLTQHNATHSADGENVDDSPHHQQHHMMHAQTKRRGVHYIGRRQKVRHPSYCFL